MGARPPDDWRQRGLVPEDRKWDDDTSSVHVRVDELRDRHKEHRADLERHGGDIGELQRDVAVVRERVEHLQRIVWWGLGVVGALTVSGSVAVLAAVLRR